MVCSHKENIFNTGGTTCKDDGGFYVCQSDGTWGKRSSCAGTMVVGLLIYVPMFIAGAMITVKAGQWGLRKLKLD